MAKIGTMLSNLDSKVVKTASYLFTAPKLGNGAQTCAKTGACVFHKSVSYWQA
jgi:hypothetical protein